MSGRCRLKCTKFFIHNRRIHTALFSSSETQGQSVKAREKARRKFSSTGGREAPSPGLENVQNIGSEWALCYRNFFHLRSLQSSQVKRSLYALSVPTSSPGRFSLALPHLQSRGKVPWGRSCCTIRDTRPNNRTGS